MSTPLAAALSPLALISEHFGHLGVWTEQPGRIGWRCRDTQCPGYNRVVDLTGVFGLRPGPTQPAQPTPAPRERRGIPGLHDPDGCQLHPGYWADNCGPCRSEVLADEHRVSTRPVGAEPTPEYLAAREALRAKGTKP